MSAPAMAASVTNKDGDTQVLVIVEGGSRMEVALEPGATETICPTGCFVTLPNGDRIALNGGEECRDPGRLGLGQVSFRIRVFAAARKNNRAALLRATGFAR
jgi:hypothetical protein